MTSFWEKAIHAVYHICHIYVYFLPILVSIARIRFRLYQFLVIDYTFTFCFFVVFFHGHSGTLIYKLHYQRAVYYNDVSKASGNGFTVKFMRIKGKNIRVHWPGR